MLKCTVFNKTRQKIIFPLLIVDEGGVSGHASQRQFASKQSIIHRYEIPKTAKPQAAVAAGPPTSREITEPGWRSQREERVPRPIYQAVISSPERETSTNQAAHQWSCACVITGRYEVGARVQVGLNGH
ncbi:hypothetical protein K0M31_011930 [Melipona bicolor]|uniref:Uncharacterized protein n=1 Tax=Melipona bicolor TaxID=60889 RepID=A0AA40GAH2_9HYME|nr:hypothetical protein K0M31_011930 [Melipona bicolor]